MIINELGWDDENIEHIARHSVNPQEVEDICFGLNISQRAVVQRYMLGGQTADGRYLNVVVERINRGLFRPITAFDMSESYKRKYKKMLER